jgi:hypothetical protein
MKQTTGLISESKQVRHLAVALVLVLAVSTAAPARAQLIGDRTQANCASVTRGSVENSTVTVICGMPPEQVVEMVRLAASPNAADHDTLIARLNAVLPSNSHFPAEAVARFLQILHEQPTDDTKLADRFAQIAEEHVRLLEEVRAFRVNDFNYLLGRHAADHGDGAVFHAATGD